MPAGALNAVSTVRRRTAFCGEPEDATQIAAIIGAVVSAVSYVVSEATVDKAAVKNDDE